MNTLTIYLKSGNKIRLRFIKDWSIKTTGDEITSLKITRNWFFEWLPTKKLIVSSIQLSEIEAITKN